MTDIVKNALVVQDGEGASLTEIQARIYLIRGVQVMLDRDLAALYQVETKALNQAVKRNNRRFPERFMFQLTKEEFENWKSQIVTSNVYSNEEIDALKKGVRRSPYAFTEQGVAQLSAVLRSDIAVDASVRIMDAFVAMRRFLTANANLFQRVDNLERRQIDTDNKLDVVLDKIEALSPPVSTEEMFATGCVWDAYTFLCDLVRKAEKRIVLVDNFVDERTLLLLDKRNAGVECVVHTRFSNQIELDFAKHNAQCAEIKKVQLPQHIHDRYLIVDDEVWLLGASAKDMGHGLCTVIKVGFTPEMVLGMLK